MMLFTITLLFLFKDAISYFVQCRVRWKGRYEDEYEEIWKGM
jgi:hypothetical protein